VASERDVNGSAKRWRLVIDGRLPAVTNMAVDRAIQIARDEGLVPPTLRLYRWQHPTVTLGRFQDADSVDRNLCADLGVDVVRRFTGGRGVLHDNELTYCVVASVDDGVPRGTAASYRVVSSALAATYRALGVDAHLVPREAGVKGSSACYLHSTEADLSRGGRKLSGSAQVWLHDTVMQHGSFVIARDVEREAAVFRLDAGAARHLGETTVTLADELGRLPDVDEIAEAAAVSFARVFGVEFDAQGLSDREVELAGGLVSQVEVD
jgi:lipoyl(octanoyl) transferase